MSAPSLEQLMIFCQEAGRPITAPMGTLTNGITWGNGLALAWRIGSPDSATFCHECAEDFSAGATLVALVKTYNGNIPMRHTIEWRHVRCFDWSTRPIFGSSKAPGLKNHFPGPITLGRSLINAVRAPRFRLELRGSVAYRKMAERIRKDDKTGANRLEAYARVADDFGIDPES